MLGLSCLFWKLIVACIPYLQQRRTRSSFSRTLLISTPHTSDRRHKYIHTSLSSWWRATQATQATRFAECQTNVMYRWLTLTLIPMTQINTTNSTPGHAQCFRQDNTDQLNDSADGHSNKPAYIGSPFFKVTQGHRRGRHDGVVMIRFFILSVSCRLGHGHI